MGQATAGRLAGAIENVPLRALARDRLPLRFVFRRLSLRNGTTLRKTSALLIGS